MKRFGLIVLLTLILLVVVFLLVVLKRMHQPLGPGLELTGVTASATTDASSGGPAATQSPTASFEASVATQSSAPSDVVGQKICGGKGAVSLLILGLTLPDNAYQRGVGAIRLVRVDFDHQDAAVLALPPDLLVEATEADTLTRIYWLAHQNTPGAEDLRHRKATQVLAQALLDNYGYVPDHFITINQAAFGQMVDAVGGIVVNIPEAIQEVPEGWHTFQAGEQTLSADQLLDYVRLINYANQTYSAEVDRLGRQDQVIRAALSAVVEPVNWVKLPKLVRDFDKLLVTDLSTSQLIDLACVLTEVGEQARQLALPLDATSSDAQGRVIVDPDSVRVLINDLTGE